MSGDVQPRKRKDKKKRKDDGDSYGVTPSNEDVTIHVHKDGGTGGNICAKIIFFFLFSALIVLVGLIIKENQGLNELESVETDSRFSQIFEGWIDKGTDEADEEHSIHLEDHDESNGPEEDEYNSLDDSEENNIDHTPEEVSNESVDDEDQEAENSESEPGSEEEEEEEEEDEYEDNEPESENIDDQFRKSTAETEERSDEDENSVEVQEATKESIERESMENDLEQQSEDNDYVKSEEIDAIIDETNTEKKESHEKEPADVALDEEVESETAKESSGLTSKIGVGIALLAVAYNVFLRKRRPEVSENHTTDSKEVQEATPDLSRRNTIVPPPNLEEVEQDLPDFEIEDKEYSEGDYSDEDSRSEHRSAKNEYQELRMTYSRSLTPEGNERFEDNNLEDDIDDEEIEPEEDLVEEEEDIYDDYDKYDRDEDEELLKRLEAKYGKLGRDVNVGEESESGSDKDDYEHSNISNRDDYLIRKDIDDAEEQLSENAAYANKIFGALLEKYPLSPRLLYGKARALDIMAEERQSNDLLKQSLAYYFKALNAPNVPDPLFFLIAERYIDRARFMGQYKNAVAAHWQLIERFPENATYLNQLAVTYLTTNMVEEARAILERVLSKWPENGFALVHYGFILKTVDNNLMDSITYMTKGLKTKAPGVIDGRFYFHLGDALTRLDRKEEANQVYEDGVKQKVFMSKYQRSLYNVDGLTAKPWWEPKDIPSYDKLFAALRENWSEIKQEGLSALNHQGYFQEEAENLRDTGTWKQLELFARGRTFSKNCAKTPITCGIIQQFPEASGCKRGQTKFSVMHPGTHVWPHCGPTNCRLRIHLGLKVPPSTFIRVAEETRSWNEGEIFIFDDSFEHEVWHNGSDFRLVLIVDVWHPDLSPEDKKNLSPI